MNDFLCVPIAESVFAVNDFLLVFHLCVPEAESIIAVPKTYHS